MQAFEVANVILGDLQGAKYYNDPESLAQFRESKELRWQAVEIRGKRSTDVVVID
jgi:hypothetical protein